MGILKGERQASDQEWRPVPGVDKVRERIYRDRLTDTREFVDPESLTRLRAETPALRDNLALLRKSLRAHVSEWHVTGSTKLGEDALRRLVREHARGTFPVSNVTF